MHAASSWPRDSLPLVLIYKLMIYRLAVYFKSPILQTLSFKTCSVSRQLSDRSNYRIKHPIIILRKYPGLDYQELANYFRDAGKL